MFNSWGRIMDMWEHAPLEFMNYNHYASLKSLHNFPLSVRMVITNVFPLCPLCVVLFLWVSEAATTTLTFWHRSFTFNSNKSPTWCNNFSVYYPDVCLQLNMFRVFSRPSSGAQWLQWQPLVLPSYRGDNRAVFVVGPAGQPDHKHSTIIITIWR